MKYFRLFLLPALKGKSKPRYHQTNTWQSRFPMFSCLPVFAFSKDLFSEKEYYAIKYKVLDTLLRRPVVLIWV